MFRVAEKISSWEKVETLRKCTLYPYLWRCAEATCLTERQLFTPLDSFLVHGWGRWHAYVCEASSCEHFQWSSVALPRVRRPKVRGEVVVFPLQWEPFTGKIASSVQVPTFGSFTPTSHQFWSYPIVFCLIIPVGPHLLSFDLTTPVHPLQLVLTGKGLHYLQYSCGIYERMTPFLQVWNCFVRSAQWNVTLVVEISPVTAPQRLIAHVTSHAPSQGRCLPCLNPLDMCQQVVTVLALCKLKRWWPTHLCWCFLSISTHVVVVCFKCIAYACRECMVSQKLSAQWNVFFPKAIKLQWKIQVRFHRVLLRLCIHGNSQVVHYFLNEHILLFDSISDFCPAKWKCIWTYSPAACNATLL